MPTAHQLAMAIRAAYLAMHRQTDACLAPLGVTADQFVILALLAEDDGITQQELVRRASSDPNTIRAMLVLLEARGFVVRRRHPTDRRARQVVLLAKGRQAYRTLWARSIPLRQRMRHLFQDDEAGALVDYLTRISEALTRPAGKRRRRPIAAVAHTLHP